MLVVNTLMVAAMLASVTEALHAVGQYLVAPWEVAAWGMWRSFWLEQILDERFVVVYFLPLVPILLLAPRDKLRVAIILTGVAFLTYLFGVFYAGLWLLTCVALHRLSERFAIECRRTDVLPAGPPLAAMVVITGWYVATMVVHELTLPATLNAWLFEHARWVFPLGARGVGWEPFFAHMHEARSAGPPFPLVHALFWDAHIIGTAYLAIRMLHYFSELKRDTIPRQRRTLLHFLAYTCYAPTLIQGPIERYAEFQHEMDTCHQRREWRNVPPGLGRIGIGLAKSIIGTLYFQPLVVHELGIGQENTYYEQPEQIGSFWLIYFGIFFQVFWLYLEFSGYCDVAAGIARLLGYRQIENFRRPWLATSMREYWRRWHISLSFILRDYVYIPLGGNRRHVMLNVCITFFLIGIWHRLSWQMGLWGLVMGLMVGINQLWAQWMKRLAGRPSGRLPAIRRGWLELHPLPTICAWLLTQHCFVFSLLIFFGGSGAVRVLREIARRVWGSIA